MYAGMQITNEHSCMHGKNLKYKTLQNLEILLHDM